MYTRTFRLPPPLGHRISFLIVEGDDRTKTRQERQQGFNFLSQSINCLMLRRKAVCSEITPPNCLSVVRWFGIRQEDREGYGLYQDWRPRSWRRWETLSLLRSVSHRHQSSFLRTLLGPSLCRSSEVVINFSLSSSSMSSEVCPWSSIVILLIVLLLDITIAYWLLSTLHVIYKIWWGYYLLIIY
jgi:hypothetical protein